jgi:hypothetical protein
MDNSIIILILKSTGFVEVYVFTFAVSQFGMFRGTFSDFGNDRRLNMTVAKSGCASLVAAINRE